MNERIVLAITGSTGLLYGIRTLELLEKTEYEVHLIVTAEAEAAIESVTEYAFSSVVALADEVHDDRNIGAKPASGSFLTNGMLIVPCSSSILSNVAHGASGTLVTRSADVMLKERRPLVLMPFERPLHRIHLQNMIDVTDAGGIIVPPVASFYQRPSTVDEILSRTMARALSFVGAEVDFEEWEGVSSIGP